MMIKINFIKKLHLEYLTNIIGKNLIIINDKSNNIYREGIHLSKTSFIYKLLFTQNFPEKEKSEIYSEYIKYELLLTRISVYYTKNLFFTAEKLILNFMNNEIDNKYIKIKYDLLSKEIIKYDKLNPFEDNLSFYFDIDIDLFDLSIKGTQNDNIFELYENIMKIILDKNIELKVYILIGYLNIIKKI